MRAASPVVVLIAILAVIGVAGCRTSAPAETDAALAARQSKQLTATFVGADTCLACHDDKAKPLERTLHGKSSDPRTPAAAPDWSGCRTMLGLNKADASKEYSCRK